LERWLSFGYSGTGTPEYINIPIGQSFTVLQEGTWFNVTPMSGDGSGENTMVYIQSSANTTMTSRTGTVTIISSSKTYIFHLTQGTSGEILNIILPDNLNLSYYNGLYSISGYWGSDSMIMCQIQSNTTWVFEVDSGTGYIQQQKVSGNGYVQIVVFLYTSGGTIPTYNQRLRTLSNNIIYNFSMQGRSN
jgi:hypothetical protein